MERDHIADLLKKLPELANTRMSGHGYAVWVSWQGENSPAMVQTFIDYGGIRIAMERNQSLWFFFSTDVFLALARLEIWSRLNPMPVFAQIMPASLPIGLKLEISLGIDSSLKQQQAPPVDEFTVLVHPKSAEAAKSMPGLTFADASKMPGLATQLWKRFTADQRLPYTSSLGWYLVIRPLGNAIDKTFQEGWRAFFQEMEPLLKKQKLQYISHDVFVMAPLANLRELRTWCKEFLTFVAKQKMEGGAYWPCVLAIVEKKGLNFNTELPKKIPLDWGQLAPDFPHMSYRSGLLLGDEFRINDVRFKVDEGSMNDWCNVALQAGEHLPETSLHIELPTRLVAGAYPHCFYCGQRSHPLQQCPSRWLEHLDLGVWDRVALMNFKDFETNLDAIDQQLAKSPDALASLLQQDSSQGLLIHAMFHIGAPFQFRLHDAAWRAIGREYPRGLQQLGPKASEPLWECLDLLRHGDLVNLERNITKELFKNPRSMPLITMRGFAALEKDDPARAMQVFAEAEHLASTPLQQAALLFLQGRVLETGGKLQQAMNLYKRVAQIAPRWLDSGYRQGVCQVKMGFAEQAFGLFQDLIYRNPHFFNYALLDPELERGHMQMLAALSGMWEHAQIRAAEEKKLAEELKNDLGKWFLPESENFTELSQRLETMLQLKDVENYVAFAKLSQQRAALSRDLMMKVEEESRRIKKRFASYSERLKEIQHESSWFPFPKLLVEFNKDFNFCVKSINWAQSQHFELPEKFRKASDLVDKVEDKVEDLDGRLKTLKIVRDSSLFVILMFKSFLWLGLASLVLSLVAMTIIGVYGESVGIDILANKTWGEKLTLQGQIFVILACISLAISALRTAFVFDSRKSKLFKEAEAQAKRLAEARTRQRASQASKQGKGAAKALPPGRAKR